MDLRIHKAHSDVHRLFLAPFSHLKHILKDHILTLKNHVSCPKIPNLIENVALCPVPYSMSSYSSSKGGGWVVGNGGGSAEAVAESLVADADLFSELAGVIC